MQAVVSAARVGSGEGAAIEIGRNEFCKTVFDLDSDSATGPDGISLRVLKTCSSALAHPLSVLFTLSFAQGHLPSTWKSANITALHKQESSER